MPTLTLADGTQVTLTVAELVEYQRQLNGDSSPAARSPRKPRRQRVIPNQSMSTKEVFLQRISGPEEKKVRQRKILALVSERPRTLNELRDLLRDPDNNKTSGTTAGITKNAKASGYTPEEVMFKDDQGRYTKGSLFDDLGIPPP